MYLSRRYRVAGVAILMCISHVLAITFFDMEHLEIGKRISNATKLNLLQNRSLIKCIGECLSRQHCQGLSYHKNSFLCLLYNETIDGIEVEHFSGFFTARDMKQWPEAIILPCSREMCPPWSQCIVHKNGTTSCEKSECPGELSDSTYTASIDHRGVGTGYAKMQCLGDKTLVGTAYRTCTLDGKWSEPNITCVNNGGWSSYSHEATPCSVTCGLGYYTATETRNCTNPPPDPGGLPCYGDSERNSTFSCSPATCPYAPRVLLRPNKVITGNSITMKCIVDALPDNCSVVWSFNRTNGKQQESVEVNDTRFSGADSTDLTIINPTTNYTGSYTCSATNTEGTGNATNELTVNGVRPWVISQMDDISFDVDNYENVTLNISVQSPDPALDDVCWRFQPLTESNNVVAHKLDIDNEKYLGSNLLEPSLTIINTSTNASGYYLAVAENDVGYGSTVILTLRIVGHGPNITTPNLVRDSNGTNITVPCSVSPDAVEVWWISTRRNFPLHGVDFSNDRFSMANSTQNATLSITDTAVSDSGTYWCLAKDADGSIATSKRTKVIIYA